MSDSPQKPSGPGLVEVESTDRWVAGKSRDELLADLKIYLARLRDNPHSLVDRLRVAAIQLRMGREQEALIHYEGVLRGYVAEGQILSAIALCRRILALYPNLPRIQRILAALYARAPRESGLPHPVTPIVGEEQVTSTFLPGDEGPRNSEGDKLVVRSVFPESRRSPVEHRGRDLLSASDDLRPTLPYTPRRREEAVPERQRKPTGPFQVEPAGENDEVVLLTRPKRKR
jgi:tetratricopeptide (TPR) repeat protein